MWWIAGLRPAQKGWEGLALPGAFRAGGTFPGGPRAAPTYIGKSGGFSGTPHLSEHICGGVKTPPYDLP